jgi:hypothetical protein
MALFVPEFFGICPKNMKIFEKSQMASEKYGNAMYSEFDVQATHCVYAAL